MRNYLKAVSFVAAIFAAVLLCGCGRSELTLTVYENGSFGADILYRITKSLMGSDEVKQQLTSIITQSLDENGIEYTETETDEYVIISVQRSFADIDELTSADAWHGISMVPKLSAEKADGSLWVRYEDGRLKIDGTLNAAAFGAEELVMRDGEPSPDFSGCFRVDLGGDIKAEFSNVEQTLYPDNPSRGICRPVYEWGGTAADSAEVSLTTTPLFPAEDSAAEPADADGDLPAGGFNPWPILAAIAAAALLIAAAVLLRRRKLRAEKTEPAGGAEAAAEAEPQRGEQKDE